MFDAYEWVRARWRRQVAHQSWGIEFVGFGRLNEIYSLPLKLELENLKQPKIEISGIVQLFADCRPLAPFNRPRHCSELSLTSIVDLVVMKKAFMRLVARFL